MHNYISYINLFFAGSWFFFQQVLNVPFVVVDGFFFVRICSIFFLVCLFIHSLFTYLMVSKKQFNIFNPNEERKKIPCLWLHDLYKFSARVLIAFFPSSSSSSSQIYFCRNWNFFAFATITSEWMTSNLWIFFIQKS